MRDTILICFALALLALLRALADPIPASRRADWTVGTSVGVIGGIPFRTNNVLHIAEAPYNADRTGVTNIATAFSSALTAATSNSVIQFTNGVFQATSLLSWNKDGTVLRGTGPYDPTNNTGTKLFLNTSGSGIGILWGPISQGAPTSNSLRNLTFTVNPSTSLKGSTNLSFDRGTNGNGLVLAPGRILNLRQDTRHMGSADFPVISAFNNIITTPIEVVTRTGTNITISQPLMYDFTNAPTALELSGSGSGGSSAPPGYMMGLENMTISLTNNGVSANVNLTQMITMNLLKNCWVSNVVIEYANNYQISVDNSINCEIRHSVIRYALSVATSHAGILVGKCNRLLIEDNIFYGVPTIPLFPTIEGNLGMGNVVSYNFSQNTSGQGFTHHSAHPMFYLLEGNVLHENVKVGDGYFGSSSDDTLFRNRITGTVFLKRFSSRMNVVGNVLGPTNVSVIYMQDFTNNYTSYGNFELGYPNTANTSYSNRVSQGFDYRWLGATFLDTGGHVHTNGMTHFTADQGPTNILRGYSFTNVPPPTSSAFVMTFQDGVDTNFYYSVIDGPQIVLSTEAGTSTNLSLWDGTFLAGNVMNTNIAIIVTNGSTLFVDGPSSRQLLQDQLKATHIITDNDCYVGLVLTNVIDAAFPDTNLPPSYLYASKPAWFGTNAWPGIGQGLDLSNPAQDRYLGIAPVDSALAGHVGLDGVITTTGTVTLQ